MKIRSIYFLLFLAVTSLYSCNNDSSSAENEQISGAPEQIKIKEAWNASHDWVKQMTLSDTLIIRKTNWGTDITQIKESAELAESQPQSGKSYSLYFDDSDLNFVDISYLANAQGQINEIDLDIYVEEYAQVSELQKSIKEYFDVKFGPSKSTRKKTSWIQNKNTQVEMEDVSTSKDPGIKIVLKAKS
jgi:hypothetical protein